MQFLFDHALAVVCGAALLLGALTLQTRSRLHEVQETMSGSARSQAVAVGETLSEEFDNTLSEIQSVAIFGSYRSRIMRDPAGAHTDTVEVPVYVRATRTSLPVPGHVRYRFEPDGESVRTADGTVPTHRLLRELDTGSGYGRPAVVGVGLVDFDVSFRGRSDESTDGVPPLQFTQIGFEVAVAVPDVTGARRYHNVARISHVIRPPNLTVGT